MSQRSADIHKIQVLRDFLAKACQQSLGCVDVCTSLRHDNSFVGVKLEMHPFKAAIIFIFSGDSLSIFVC